MVNGQHNNYVSFHLLRNENHEIFLRNFYKVALDPIDGKRKYINNVASLPRTKKKIHSSKDVFSLIFSDVFVYKSIRNVFDSHDYIKINCLVI